MDAKREREEVKPRERERACERDARGARACHNIRDTHEAKVTTPDAPTERGQTPREGEQKSDTHTVSDLWGTGVCE